MNDDAATRVRQALDRYGIEHEMMPCHPEFADTALFCEKYAIPPENSANALLVASKKEPKQYAAALVLATTRLDVNRRMSELMGIKRLSFAAAEETAALTGMVLGGVTVFGLPETLPIYVDSRVMARPWIIVGGGTRSWKVKLPPRELEKLPNVTVIDGLATDR